MSKPAAIWAEKVRGLTIAEKAVLKEMAYVHTDKGCYPSLSKIARQYESTRRYIERIARRIQAKGFIDYTGDYMDSGKRWNNRYTLHLHRFFPPSPAADRILTQIKVVLKTAMNSEFYETWVECIQDCYLEEKRKAPQKILWLAVDSKSNSNTVIRHLPAINVMLKEKFGVVTRKLPNSNTLQQRRTESPAEFDKRKKAYEAKRAVPAITIEIHGTYPE